MKELKYEDFIKGIAFNLKFRHPLNGHLELTYCCNLDCIHCYCKGSEKKDNELNTQEWIDIIDDIHREGCLWLNLTGGEPLLRKDFLDIYAYAHKKGFLISIFTSGTLVPSKVIKFFKVKSPHLIEITLYGVTDKVYESITQVHGSFKRVIDNINRLIEIKMPLVLKTVGLKQNKDEIIKVKALSERLLGKKRFKFDSFIFPRLNGDTAPCRYRLSPKDILEIENNNPDMTAQRKEQFHQTFSLKKSPQSLYQCDIWLTGFFINPYGRLQFCHLTDNYSSDLKKTSFKDAFYKEFPKLLDERFTTDSKCRSCSLRGYCYFCPARAYLETGDQEGPVEYYCQLAKMSLKQKGLLKR